MELYHEMLLKLLSEYEMRITFPGLPLAPENLLENTCYRALSDIRAILRDDSLEDAQCLYRIEQIVCLFEGLGSDGGTRHDFG